MTKTDQMRSLREARYASRGQATVRRPVTAPKPSPSPASALSKPEPDPAPEPPVMVEPTPAPAAVEAVVEAPEPETVEAETVAEKAVAPSPEVAVAAPTGRPDIPVGRAIHLYKASQLNDLVTWLASDGKPRTMEDYIVDVMADLQFVRRGKKIVAAINDAVAATGVPVTSAAA